MIWPFVRLELSIIKRYRFRVLTDVISLFLTLTLFYFLSKSLGPTQAFKGEYFPYLLIGVLFNRLFQAFTNSAVSMLTDYQYLGVLEPMLAGQKHRWKIILSAGFPMIIRDIIAITLTLIICLLLFGFKISFLEVQWGLILTTLFLFIIFSTGLSIFAVGSVLYFKRVNLVNYLSSIGTSILTGVYFPTNVLPEWVQSISSIIPMTHALKLIRLGIGAPVEETNQSLSLGIMAVSALLSILIGFIFYFKMEKEVLRKGTILGI